ncbi:hypothetical protein BH09MYX1_BH09MYX1_45350 [soil metagenome]
MSYVGGMVAGSSIRGFLQSVYSLTSSREAWLHGMARAADATLGHHGGAMAAVFDARDPTQVKCVEVASSSGAPYESILDHAFRGIGPEYVTPALGMMAMAGTPSSSGGKDQPGIVEYMAKVGARDLLTLIASDPSGLGVMINVHLQSQIVMDRRLSATFAHLAMHVASASRLRESEASDDVAVFRHDGTLVHAESDVRESEAIAPLRDVVRALTRMQTHRGGAATLAKLTSRVEAQWTVVARFNDETDAFVVARRNAAPVGAVPDMEKLTPREREVVSFLARGHSQKSIAYELGIAPSTVRVLIARARATLGMKDTPELLRRITGS